MDLEGINFEIPENRVDGGAREPFQSDGAGPKLFFRIVIKSTE
jgi:hypothetical protein